MEGGLVAKILNSNVADNVRGRVDDIYARATRTVAEDYDYGKDGGVTYANGHFTDKGKLPSHPTFSVESDYSTEQTPGGVWTKEAVDNVTLQDVYTPSTWMAQQPGRIEGLARYMAVREPNVVLNMPAPYRPTNVMASYNTPEGKAYVQAKIKELETQDKGLKDTSDTMGLAIGAVGPATRSLLNAAGGMLRKKIDPGWGAFMFEQGLENAVQNQVQEDK